MKIKKEVHMTCLTTETNLKYTPNYPKKSTKSEELLRNAKKYGDCHSDHVWNDKSTAAYTKNHSQSVYSHEY